MDNSVARQEHVPPVRVTCSYSCCPELLLPSGITERDSQHQPPRPLWPIPRCSAQIPLHSLSLPPAVVTSFMLFPGWPPGVTVDGRAGTRAEPSLAPAGFLPQVVFAPELPPELPMSTNTRSGLRLVCGLPMPNPAPDSDSLPSPGCSRHNVFSLSSLSASVSPELPPGSTSFR